MTSSTVHTAPFLVLPTHTLYTLFTLYRSMLNPRNFLHILNKRDKMYTRNYN